MRDEGGGIARMVYDLKGEANMSQIVVLLYSAGEIVIHRANGE